MDVIVTDHHLPEKLPDAFVLCPNARTHEPILSVDSAARASRKTCLCDSKVRELRDACPSVGKVALDMVGLATIADMVPLVMRIACLRHTD